MKKIYGLLSLLAVLILCSSCNDEWKDEQFEHFVSFVATIGNDDGGVSPIYVRYKANEKVTYQLPVIVSGSTTNDKDIAVHVGVDPDTLDILNYDRFQNRTDFYYEELASNHYSFPEVVNIPAGKDKGLLEISFTLAGVDLVKPQVLPLTILEDPSYGYEAHPRKWYKKALLRVNPFNDYSGTYGATTLKTYIVTKLDPPKPDPDNAGQYIYEELSSAIVRQNTTLYVSDENQVFLYAGMVDENFADRDKYKVFIDFDKETGFASFSSNNPDMEFVDLGFDPYYYILERMDATRPYLLHRYLTITNIGYEFVDYTTVPGEKIIYRVEGLITMERQINTQIPDEDQAIEW
ncbi:MAG: DUF4973 domain-containing protein [Prevotella sp.]|nr:DUF4973 domain-containing protein [Prevotella sp.]